MKRIIGIGIVTAVVVVGVGGWALRSGAGVDTIGPAAAAAPSPAAGSDVGSSGSSSTSTAPAFVPHEIVFLGDSITDQARGRIEDELHAAPDDIRATGGLRVEEMQYAATALAPRRPEQVVINLGTNNVLQGDDTGHAATALEDMIAVYPNARCVHLVTINEDMLGPSTDVHTGAVRLNERLRQIAAADPRVRLIDWATIALEHDHPGDPAWPITTDNVHPTPSGQTLLLDAYRTSIDAC